MGRAAVLMLIVLVATWARAAEEPSPRRDMFILGGADLAVSHLRVTEDGQPDRTLHGPTAFLNLGLGWHISPRTSLSIIGESLHEDPRYRVLSFVGTWYPRGWTTASGSWFVEGRWGMPGTLDEFPGTGCAEWVDDFGGVVAAGLGWERVLGRNRGGAARWSARLLASLHGVSSEVGVLDRKEPVTSIRGVTAKLGAALVWAPSLGDKEPWSEEPDAYGYTPFFGLGAGWGHGRTDVLGVDGPVDGIDSGGPAAWWRFGFRWRWGHIGFDHTRWSHDDLQHPDLRTGLLLVGVGLGGLPVEVLAGAGGTYVHVDRAMGDCVPVELATPLTWSLGVAGNLVAGKRWSVDLRAIYMSGGDRYKADTFHMDDPPVESGEVLTKAIASQVIVGLSVDWHLLPLRRR